MVKESLNRRTIIIILLIITTLSALLYRDSFSAYFFQDDWFTLKIGSAKSISDFLGFFIPRTDVIYYRPIGMQLPFFLLQSIFGLNPFPFHLLTFVTHVVNIVLIFLLIDLLTKRKSWALLVAFFYGTSAVHYTPFFWSSTYPFVLGPTMFFLSFILFLRFLSKYSPSRSHFVTPGRWPDGLLPGEYWELMASFAVFLLGLLTNEIVFILPLILILYLLLCYSSSDPDATSGESRSYLKNSSRQARTINYKLWKSVVPYILTGGIFFLGRFLLFPAPVSSDYKLSIGKHILQNMEAYFFWSFNLPEEMKAQLIRFFIFNSQFVREFRSYFIIFMMTLFINVLFFYIIPILRIREWKKEKNSRKLILLGLIWFVIGLLPVLFFPNHVFSYYLPISLVGLLLASVVLFEFTRLPYFVLFILIINWLLVSGVTIDFNSKIHWIPRRASLSKILIDRAKKLYPVISPNGQVIFVSPSSENKLALNGQDGLQVVYNNETILTIYETVVSKESL